MILDEACVVAPKPGVRLRFDPVRGRHVLLAPERVLFPCPTTVEILERIPPGGTTIARLVDGLAQEYDAARETIAEDVLALLGQLAKDRLIRVEREDRDVDAAA
ncbi:Coenzyme PQQ synthesis protein D [bacterium HR40]|nr:Coenzyme PQQ synthesis protein D [bacterium HR40]